MRLLQTGNTNTTARYFTVSRLAPKDWVASISWITGWINLLGQIAGVASSEYGAAQMLLAAVSMGSDFNYTITTNATIGVMAALTVLTGLVNSLSTYWMEKMTKTYVIFHVLVLVSCAIALLVKTDHKNDAKYVFTDVDSTSGWQPTGFSFLFGFLSVSWTMTDYDATAHITEEISEPEIKAPWAISLAMLFTYLAGFLFNIVLCFCMVRISKQAFCTNVYSLSRVTPPPSSHPQSCNRLPRSSTTVSESPEESSTPSADSSSSSSCASQPWYVPLTFPHANYLINPPPASPWSNRLRLLP